METCLKVSNIKKSYGSTEALRDLSFQCRAGRIMGVLGPNGAGKSTLFNILSGLISADSGIVEYFQETKPFEKIKSQFGMTPQNHGFPKRIKVREVLEFVRAHHQNTFLQKELIEVFHLESLLNRYAGQLSEGQKRRVALACAFVGQPKLILLDEPTTGVDLVRRHHIFTFINKYVKAHNATLLFSTHHMEEVEALADDILVLNKGQVIKSGPVDEVKSSLLGSCLRFKKDLSFDYKNIPATLQVGEEEVRLMTNDTDKWIQYLVNEKIPFSELRVEQNSIEDLYLAAFEEEAH